MNQGDRCAIVISASSDIGKAMCQRWLARGWKAFGTYRTPSPAVAELNGLGARLVHCDLSDRDSVLDACSKLRQLCPQWDILAMCPGAQEPVGAFSQGSFDEWEESLRVNFSSQMRIIHELLATRRTGAALDPIVLLFAGAGTNSAPPNYSAYVVSKIALIKMCELLDAEMPDTRFAIVGPGWVKTKIHEATMRAGARAGANYQRTLAKLAGDDFTPMEEVLDCCDWLVNAPRHLVSGRNFSVVYDKWGTEDLAKMLAQSPDMYKLRRYGNDRLVKKDEQEGKHKL